MLYWRIVSFSQIIPIIYALSGYKSLGADLKIYTRYLILTLIYSGGAWIAAVTIQNNIWLVNIFMLVTVGVTMWIYSLWQSNIRWRLALRFSILLFAVIWGMEMVALGGLMKYTFIAKPALDILLIAGSCLIIIQTIQQFDSDLLDQP